MIKSEMKTKIKKIHMVALYLGVAFFLSSCQEETAWTFLLDKDMSQWEMYLGYKLTTDYNGEKPTDEDGVAIEPIGYNNNVNNVFTVIEEDGEPVLKISGEIYGCVYTKQEFENYHLKMKVKWGDKKWPPRLDKLRDSGVMYHSIGDCGIDYWRAWMLSQELQIMEGHMGDFWSIENSVMDIRALLPEDIMNPVANEKQPFIPIGGMTKNNGFCLRSADYESPKGESTEVELICYGDKSIHIVNGHVVMVLQNSRYMMDGQTIPLTKGKIQIQSEAAEVYYKDIVIRSIDSLPEAYKSFFD